MPIDDLRSRLAKVFGIEPGSQIGLGFAVRTTCAGVAALLLCESLHLASPVWAVVSSVVVIMPELRASMSSALLRVTANLIGAGIGFGVSLTGLPSVPSLLVALPAAALVCRLIAIGPAARTASVAVVIVLLKDPFAVGVSSEARVALVLLGCAVALVVTVLASAIEKAIAWRRGAGDSVEGPS